MTFLAPIGPARRAALCVFAVLLAAGGALEPRTAGAAPTTAAPTTAAPTAAAPTAAAPTAAPAGDDISIEAHVQPSPVDLRGELTYVLTISGAALSEIDELPPPPRAAGLQAKNGRPQIEQDVVLRNGQLRRTLALRWQYRPRQTGKTRFAPLTVTIQGHSYRTAPIQARVVSRARHNLLPPHRTHAAAPSGVFIKAALSDSTLYRGEQAVVAYRLFYRKNMRLRQSRMAGSWNAPGFWREELDVPSHPDVGTTTRGGETYKTLLLKRVAVFPTRTGRLTLSPLKIETHAQRPGHARSLLGRLFNNGRTREMDVSSDSVSLRVRPLPGGAPAAFQGAVGTFRIDLRTGKKRTKVGHAVDLKLKVSGYGNLATLEAPMLDTPAGLEAYPPEARASIDRGGDRVRGTKTFTYTLIPQKHGTYQVPPLVFSYFAPDAGRYQTLRTDPVTIRATGNSRELAVPSQGLPPGDLAGPLTSTAVWTRPGGTALYRRVWPYAAFGGPALLAALLLAWRRRRRRAEERPPEAHPTARKRLREARRHLEHDRPRSFYEEVERALRAFVGQRLGVSATGQTHRELRAAFARAGLARATQDRFFALLDECDRARFAPTPPDREATQTASDRAHRLVATLDEALPPAPARA